MHEAYELIVFKLHSNLALPALFHYIFTITRRRYYFYYPHCTGKYR